MSTTGTDDLIRRGDVLNMKISISAKKDEKELIQQVVKAIMDYVREIPAVEKNAIEKKPARRKKTDDRDH